MNSQPSPVTSMFQAEVEAAAKALLIDLQTDEASLEFPTEDGGKLVIEILHFPPPGTRSSSDALRLLPDPIAEAAAKA